MKRKFGIFSAIAVTGAALLAIALSSVSNIKLNLIVGRAANQDYSLTLDSCNKVTSACDKV